MNHLIKAVLTLFILALFSIGAYAQTSKKVVVIPLGGDDVKTCIDQNGGIECGIDSTYRIPINRQVNCRPVTSSFLSVAENIRYLDEKNSNISFFQADGAAPRFQFLYYYDNPAFGSTRSYYRVSYNNGTSTQQLYNIDLGSCDVPEVADSTVEFTSPTGTKWKITSTFENINSYNTFVNILFERLP